MSQFIPLLYFLPIPLIGTLGFLYSQYRTLRLENQNLKKKIDNLECLHSQIQEENISLKTQFATLQSSKNEQNKAFQEKISLLEKSELRLKESFKALSHEALKSNNESFMGMAKATFSQLKDGVNPIKEALQRFDSKINALEKTREGAYVSLLEQVKHLSTTQAQLQSETSTLSRALRSPNVRGQWGEMQLKRAVELAGMVNRVDFIEQATSDNGKFRPDMVINLPNSRKIIVDSKAPLSAYLESIEEENLTLRKSHLQEHSRHIRDHLTQLGSKSYWKQFEDTPEFVVLFLPGEAFFSAALEEDPRLVDFGIENQVILATPTTLIALLKAVAYGWKQESIAQEAKTISNLGLLLYERMSTLSSHFADMRKSLEKLNTSYNKSISCLESRVLPTARKFKDLNSTSDKEIPILEHTQTPLSSLKAEELQVI